MQFIRNSLMAKDHRCWIYFMCMLITKIYMRYLYVATHFIKNTHFEKKYFQGASFFAVNCNRGIYEFSSNIKFFLS